MFEQRIADGWQVEYPDYWLSYGNPWEIERTDIRYVIHFGGRCVRVETNGIRKYIQQEGETILAVAYDTPVPGYNTHNCNVLRLWRAIPTDVQLNSLVNSRKSIWRCSTRAITRPHWRARGAPKPSRACSIPTIPS